MAHIYKVAYRIDFKPEGVSAEDLVANNLGGTDALALISLIRSADGSLSTAIASLDGATGGRLDGNEMFKVWVFLAKYLADSKDLGPGKRMFANQTFETIREMILKESGAHEQGG